MDGLRKAKLIMKGAEASLYIATWHGRRVMAKIRLPKKYRAAVLDRRIKTYRTIHETQMLRESKKAGVPAPTVFLVDVKNSTIVMEFVAGKQLRNILNKISAVERQRLCRRIGELVGRFHRHGIIHGDLTTSNMIQNAEGKIFIVDFGLSEKSSELEDKGVDLHLLKRSLESTHVEFAEECFNVIVQGYSSVVKPKMVEDVLARIRQIERRGRYIVDRKSARI